MTEPSSPKPNGEPNADETFTWTGEGSSGAHDDAGATGSGGSRRSTGSAGAGAQATAILDSLKEAVDDLAERATPAVREISARAAELAATAADRAAPLAKRAGEATSEASGRLAEKSRSWASEVRASMGQTDADASAGSTRSDVPPPTPGADRGPSAADGGHSGGPTAS